MGAGAPKPALWEPAGCSASWPSPDGTPEPEFEPVPNSRPDAGNDPGIACEIQSQAAVI